MVRKILFVEAVDAERQYKFPGAGIGFLITALRQAFGPDRFDIRVQPGDAEAAMDAFEPDVVAISSMTATFERALAAARAARQRGIPVMIGGVHITLLPACLSADMDVGVVGDGEATIVDLMTLLDRHGRWRPEDLGATQGICYRDDQGALVTTALRPPAQDIDALGHVAWEDLPQKPEGYILSSRGCPYKCVFCSSSHYWGALRFHSPEYTVEAIERAARRHPGDLMWIMDDLFIAKGDRVAEITALIRRRGLHQRLRFAVAGARANLVTAEVVDLLRSINTVAFGLGVESGDPETLAYLKRDTVTVDENVRAIETIRAQGLTAFGYLMVGAPGETVERARRTVRFARRHLGEMFHVSLLTPLPGTPVWELACERGLARDDMDWSLLQANYDWDVDRAILVNDAMTRDDVRRVYGELVRFQKGRRAGRFLREAVAGPGRFGRQWLAHPRRAARALGAFWESSEQAY